VAGGGGRECLIKVGALSDYCFVVLGGGGQPLATPVVGRACVGPAEEGGAAKDVVKAGAARSKRMGGVVGEALCVRVVDAEGIQEG
jgi:hypothetical protein